MSDYPLNAYDLFSALASNRPVIALVKLTVEPTDGSGSGHFVVVYGLDLDRNEIYYHDPLYGANKTAPWERFDEAWRDYVDKGDPLQPGGHVRWAY